MDYKSLYERELEKSEELNNFLLHNISTKEHLKIIQFQMKQCMDSFYKVRLENEIRETLDAHTKKVKEDLLGSLRKQGIYL